LEGFGEATFDVVMSGAREKRRKREAPMPAASAGLLRFFEEETPGVKIRPELVVMMSIGLVAVSLFMYLTFKP
ncbi:MAG TPA: preprotein translocase subunit Sec61beta, partial [Candidatus Acidoferrales bacterium]|nr:preprotein translocase subunit Sec61beta [Candidatus Acidoferrales bacterium]